MTIQAILFDLGKVLVDFDLAPMLRKMTLCCSRPASELESLMRDAALLSRFESGDMTLQQYYDHVCQAVGLQMEMPAFRAAISSIFTEELLVSEDLLKSLHERYPLILVSNTNEVHARHIGENYRLFEYFDHKVLSHEVRATKPDRRIFEHAIAVSGKRSEELFFTDDREENVRAARELGIHAHQFTTETMLVSALQDAGVDLGNFVQRDPLRSHS